MVDTRQQFDHLAGVYWPVAIAVSAAVVGLLGFVGVRFRHRAGRAVSSRTKPPKPSSPASSV